MIAVPLVVAALMLFLKQDSQRDPVAIAGAGATALAAIATGVLYMNNPQFFVMSPGLSLAGNYVAVAIDLLLCAVVLVYAVRWRNPFAMAIGAVQMVASIWCGSLAMAPEDAFVAPMYIDNLSVIMVLIVGIVGSVICVYALGYMKDFQHHEDAAAAREGREPQDRRNKFLALMFLFLSAMFVIVLSDNMDWILAGWEITTVCSFLMIGYTQTPEAKKNALLQINLNMVGGLAFHIAVIYLHTIHVPLSINAMPAIAQSADSWTTHQRASALVHHGQGGRVPVGQAGSAVPYLSRGVLYGGGRGRHHLCAMQLHGHLAEQR